MTCYGCEHCGCDPEDMGDYCQICDQCDDMDDEIFCDHCFAGVESSEHFAKCELPARQREEAS